MNDESDIKLPCIDCITLSICKNEYMEIHDLIIRQGRSYAVSSACTDRLSGKCSLINNFLRKKVKCSDGTVLTAVLIKREQALERFMVKRSEHESLS